MEKIFTPTPKPPFENFSPMKIHQIFILTCLFITLFTNAFPQNNEPKIPKGVVYQKKPDNINKKAQELIAAELSTKNNSYNLFDSILIIGPILWEKYSKIPIIAKIKEGNISLKVSSYDSAQNKRITELISAKLIQRNEDYATVITQIIKDINEKSLKFRKLNEFDLTYYWSVIFFDIEEPIFIIEANGRKFLFDLDANYKIKWIDEVL